MQTIKKHSFKIAVWTVITVVLAVVVFGIRAWVFMSDVAQNTDNIEKNTVKIDKVLDKIWIMNELVVETSTNVKRLVQEEMK